MKKGIVLFFILFGLCGCSQGLMRLIKVGKSQEGFQKELAKETESFEAVKEAIGRGEIKKSQSRDFIRELCGGPVVVIYEENDEEKWVYKPGYATFFDNNKVYLFFDKEGLLKNYEILTKPDSK
ncbi:MAG: hypothetical protein KAU12_01715 [Candidatus Omnitrophica bacterium]|nr:hypothetical protein [Candidatus Omnitrophota bacterium]